MNKVKITKGKGSDKSFKSPGFTVILCLHAPNKIIFKYIKQKLPILQEEIENSTITMGLFKTPFLLISRENKNGPRTKQKKMLKLIGIGLGGIPDKAIARYNFTPTCLAEI